MSAPTKRVKRSPETFKGADGVECIRIRLAHEGQYAVLNCEDAAAWTQAGLSWQWAIGADGYVRTNVPSRGPCNVARLLMGATINERVEYADGDRLNLRRENLSAHLKHSKAQAAASAYAAFEALQAQRRHEARA